MTTCCALPCRWRRKAKDCLCLCLPLTMAISFVLDCLPHQPSHVELGLTHFVSGSQPGRQTAPTKRCCQRGSTRGYGVSVSSGDDLLHRMAGQCR